MTQTGSPDPGNDRITSSYPRQLVLPIDRLVSLSQDVSNSFGSLYLSPRTMMAQAMRAIFLASATEATFAGRRSIKPHACFS